MNILHSSLQSFINKLSQLGLGLCHVFYLEPHQPSWIILLSLLFCFMFPLSVRIFHFCFKTPFIMFQHINQSVLITHKYFMLEHHCFQLYMTRILLKRILFLKSRRIRFQQFAGLVEMEDCLKHKQKTRENMKYTAVSRHLRARSFVHFGILWVY